MARKYRVTFEPLADEAITFLSWATSIDFMSTDFRSDDNWFCCSAYDRDIPIIVVVFEFKTPWDAHLTLAVADQKALTRKLITTLYKTVFDRAARVTAMIEPGNRLALQQAWRMGFKPEGYMRRAYNGIADATVWGLLPEDCPYLRGTPFRYRVVRQTHPQVTRIQ